MRSLHIFILFLSVVTTKINGLSVQDTFTMIIMLSPMIPKAHQVLKSLVVKQVCSLYNLKVHKQDMAKT